MSRWEMKNRLLEKIRALRKEPQQCAVAGVIAIALLVLLICGIQALASPGIEVIGDGDKVAGEAQPEDDLSEEGIYVHVSGEVVNPGVYILPFGSRVVHAIEAAGGFSADADEDSVNLAATVSDGERVLVSAAVEASGSAASSSTADNGLVNINTASLAELQTLKGIGESTARKIVAYREANGSFSSIEELKNVSGIGDKKYAAIAQQICI